MWILLLLCTCWPALANDILPDEPLGSMPTRTVYGFLDFTTTVSNTVMVFKPQSKPTDKLAKKIDAPEVAFKKAAKAASKKKLHSAAIVEASESDTVIEGSLTTPETYVHDATERIESGRSNDGSGKAKLSVYKLKDVLSPIGMQSPTEVNKPNSGLDQIQKPLDPNHKLGLISKYGGTVIKHGITTVHETSVIGTYINGKYAQLKSSASTVFMAQTTEPTPARKGSVQVVLEDNPKVKPAVIEAAIAVSQVTPLPLSENSDGNLPLESLFGMTKTETTTRKPFKPTSKPTKADPGTKASAQEDFLQRLQRHRQSQISSEDNDQAETVAKKSVLKPSFRNRNSKTTNEPTTQPPPETTTEDRPRYTRRAGYIVSKKRQNVENDLNKASEPSRVISVRKLQNTGERWRYQPSPKPTLNIHGKNRFQQHREEKITQRTTTTTTTEKYEEDYEETYNNYSPQDTYSSPEKQEFYDSYDETPEVEPTVVTLHVQTVTPTGYSDIHLEVVTLKSPHVMRIGYSKSTRYLTVTKTSTRHSPRTVTPQPELERPEFDEPIDPAEPYPEENTYIEEAGLDPAPVQEEPVEQETRVNFEEVEMAPETISEAPAPVENEFIEPSMSTVTETFSTVELMTKTSIVNYVKGKISTQMTLTQSYYITRLISAVKTVPIEFFQQNVADAPLDEAATQNHSRLPDGELNFDDEYDENIPNQKRVIRHPYSSKTDLSDIGNDFDPSEYERVELEPSLVDTSALLVEPTPPLNGPSVAIQQTPLTIQATPTFPDTASMSPEQIQQLAYMRYMNPYAALNPYMNPLSFGLPQLNPVVPQVSSRPVLRTSEIMKTDLVPIWNGVSTIYSTLTRKLGVTTITDYETVTTTAPANPFAQFTVTSSPVVIDTITTSTDYRTYRIIFRAQTTVTTVTSTSVFPTVMTSYVTSSIQVQPSVFPGMFPGMGGVPFPGFLG